MDGFIDGFIDDFIVVFVVFGPPWVCVACVLPCDELPCEVVVACELPCEVVFTVVVFTGFGVALWPCCAAAAEATNTNGNEMVQTRMARFMGPPGPQGPRRVRQGMFRREDGRNLL